LHEARPSTRDDPLGRHQPDPVSVIPLSGHRRSVALPAPGDVLKHCDAVQTGRAL
jgi:hypothetical protein